MKSVSPQTAEIGQQYQLNLTDPGWDRKTLNICSSFTQLSFSHYRIMVKSKQTKLVVATTNKELGTSVLLFLQSPSIRTYDVATQTSSLNVFNKLWTTERLARQQEGLPPIDLSQVEILTKDGELWRIEI